MNTAFGMFGGMASQPMAFPQNSMANTMQSFVMSSQSQPFYPSNRAIYPATYSSMPMLETSIVSPATKAVPLSSMTPTPQGRMAMERRAFGESNNSSVNNVRLRRRKSIETNEK